MFSFFKKKDTEVKVTDHVWLKENNKFENILRRLDADPRVICLVWDHHTMAKLSALSPSENISSRLLMAAHADRKSIGDVPVVFSEHHPSAVKEQELFRRLQLKTVEVYTSLDEKFLTPLLNDSFQRIMDQLGLKEDEELSHSMISSAIRKAQDKYVELNPIL
jgi:hypothetical protein